jgi:tRNA U34 5-carboxymethylaminomethyl modifying enzyme MnmG/GidA
MKAVLERAQNLDVKQGTVVRVVDEAGAVSGVETDIGVAISTRTVVDHLWNILAGSFACRRNSKPGGRMADA